MKKILLSIGFILSSFCHADTLSNEDPPHNTTRSPFNFPKNLHKACYNGDIESVQNFLRSGHKVSEIDIEGTTPVHNLFTNIGVGQENPRIDPYNKKTIELVLAIYKLLQSSTRHNIMKIKDQQGITPKDTLFSELRFWCRDAENRNICQQYSELFYELHQRDIL